MEYKLTEQQLRYLESILGLVINTPTPSRYCSCNKEISGANDASMVRVQIQNGLTGLISTIKQQTKEKS